jgi:hypothetical protein
MRLVFIFLLKTVALGEEPDLLCFYSSSASLIVESRYTFRIEPANNEFFSCFLVTSSDVKTNRFRRACLS